MNIYLTHRSRQAKLDRICRAHSGFRSFQELLEAKGSYRPTLYTWILDLAYLADCYDSAMAAQGDDRRTYRYGDDRIQIKARNRAFRRQQRAILAAS